MCALQIKNLFVVAPSVIPVFKGASLMAAGDCFRAGVNTCVQVVRSCGALFGGDFGRRELRRSFKKNNPGRRWSAWIASRVSAKKSWRANLVLDWD